MGDKVEATYHGADEYQFFCEYVTVPASWWEPREVCDNEAVITIEGQNLCPNHAQEHAV